MRRGEKCVFLHKPLSWMSLEKDSPEGRSVQPAESGRVVAVTQVAGCIIGANVAPPKPRTSTIGFIEAPFLRRAPGDSGAQFEFQQPFLRRSRGLC